MKSLLALAFAAIVFAGFSGCNRASDAVYEGEKLTLTQLRATPGFAWFDGEVATYSPDADAVSKIKKEYQAKNQKIYVYVNPSCSCTGTKKRFPQAIRILQDAGVKESDIIIISMHNSGDKQPFAEKFSVRGLPSFFITKDETPVYAIQTINQILIANPPSQTDKPVESQLMEEIILDGFKQ